MRSALRPKYLVLGLIILGLLLWIWLSFFYTPYHLEISDTKWIVPKQGSERIEFHILAPGKIADVGENARPLRRFGGILLVDDQRWGGEIVFPHFNVPNSVTLDPSSGKIDIKIVGDIIKDETGARFLAINGAHTYPLPETGEYEVFAYFGVLHSRFEKKTNYVTVNVSDQ